MNQFQYVRPTETLGAIKSLGKTGNTHFLAGGTNLIDMMKMDVLVPEKLVDINNLPLKTITKTISGIRIGALVSNTAVAEHPFVKQSYPLLSMALNAGASPQLRNMATVGGNLMQRTRCAYFWDVAMPCNKRQPGSGCSALNGYNRMHAIFGASDSCIAVNPSDMNIALAALDATVNVMGNKGQRAIHFSDFHRLPGNHPELDNTLQKDELITSVDIPLAPYQKKVFYLKVRDRASYAFALVSVGAALNIEGNIIKSARLAMGGVAHKPWRLLEAERFMIGKTASEETFKSAAMLSMTGAKAYQYNQFKLKLAPNTIIQALKTAAGINA